MTATRGGPSSGVLVGVGVGPGDPEAVTLQAVRTIREADRVLAPSLAADAVGRAEAVVRQAVPGVPVERVVFAMTTAPGERHASHRAAAVTITDYLDGGEEVAFVTLGDPNVYSTFSSLAAAVTERRPGTQVRTVAGVMALQDLAARTATVLLDGTESLRLITALDGPEAFEQALEDPRQAVALYKGGRHLPAILRALGKAGRLDDAVIGELLGLPGERVLPARAWPEEPASYLVTVIVPPASRTGGNR